MFSAEQLQPRTRAAVGYALLMIILIQAGYMILDLALKKFAAGRLNDTLSYLITAALLGLGAYVGIARACVRYPLADRTAIFWCVSILIALIGTLGVLNSVPHVGWLRAIAIQGFYLGAQTLAIWLGARFNTKPAYLPRA